MKYDAFISYRHTELDMYVAKKLHKGLETFKVPGVVAKKYGKSSLKRVFRDQEELPIGSDLNDNISEALKESEYLIVICSPRSRESYWVKKEITTFIELHDRDHVLAVLIEGEPDEAFQEELLTDENGNPVEPLAADVRGDSKRIINKKLKTEIVRLCAPLLHCSYDDLRQRHRERKMRRIIAISSIIATVVAVLGISFGVYNARKTKEIQANYEAKQINQSKYLSKTSERLLSEGNREAAVLVALEALGEKEERPYVAEAQKALSDALYAYESGNRIGPDTILKNTLTVKKMTASSDGRYLSVVDNAEMVYVYETDTNKLYMSVDAKTNNGKRNEVVLAQMIDDYLTITYSDCVCTYVNGTMTDRKDIEDMITKASYNPDTNLLALLGSGIVTIYDPVNCEVLKEINFGEDDGLSIGAEWFDADTLIVRNFNANRDVIFRINVKSGALEPLYSNDGETYSVSGFTVDKENGAVLILLCTSDYESVNEYEKYVIRSYSIKEDFGEMHWENSFEVSGIDVLYSKVIMKCHSNKDTDMNQVVISLGKSVYTFDSLNGSLISKIDVAGNIATILVSASTPTCYAAKTNGEIMTLNVTKGLNYEESKIDANCDISDLIIKNGKMYIQCSMSPNVLVLGYHTGADMKELKTFETDFLKGGAGRNGDYYFVGSGLDSGPSFSFFRSADDEPVGEFTADDTLRVEYSGFAAENSFVCAYRSGRIEIVKLPELTVESIGIPDEYSYESYKLSNNGQYLATYYYDRYVIFDLENKSIVCDETTEESIKSIDVSNDGKLIAVLERTGRLLMYDLEASTTGTCTDPSFVKISELYDTNTVEISRDMSKILIYGNDSTIKIVDVQSKEITASIPCPYRHDLYATFGMNMDYVYIQGENYYFKVWSLKEGRFIYESDEQFGHIQSVEEDIQNNILCVVTGNMVYMLDRSNFSLIGAADKGLLYIPGENGGIITRYYENCYRFPVYTKERLIEIAREYVKRDLTEEERIKYNID